MLEAGDPDNYPWIHIPVGYFYCIGNLRTDWCLDASEVSGFSGRSLKYPRGEVLGGCSSINSMIYMRDQARDYDQRVTEGNLGWSWGDLLPLFRRMKGYFARTSEMHGAGGEWRIERQQLSWKLLDAFQQAAAQTGIASVEDFNGSDNESCDYFQASQRDGVRWNASKGSLRGIVQRANLTALTHAEVQRAFLKDGRARALSVRRQGREQRFEVCREIVLNASAAGSSCLLQRSRVDPRGLLEWFGIGVIHELPGVGGNLQDHLQLCMIYRVDGAPILNQIVGSLWGKLGMGLHYLASRSGLLSMTPSQLGVFARSDPQQPSASFEYHVQPPSLGRSGESLHIFPASTVSVYDLRPHSRGTVHIRSPNSSEAPSIQPSYLSDPCDLKAAADATHLTRRIAAALALATFRPREYKPGPKYRSEEDLQRVVARIGTTIFHPTGTCRMSQGPQVVVDTQLRTHRIPGLRIADASIMPSLTSGNTCSLILIITEKAVQMILAKRRREATPQVIENAMAIGGRETAEA